MQHFASGERSDKFSVDAHPPEVEAVRPETVVSLAPGSFFVDFGLAAFGSIELTTDLDKETDLANRVASIPRVRRVERLSVYR
ncbi:MAG: hypothetical protein ACOC4F_02555 [bacterium]